MAAPTLPTRWPAAIVAATVTALLLLAGCSSSGSDAADGTSTSTSIPPSGTTGTSGSPTTSPGTSSTTEPIPSAPSTLPGSVDGTCSALGETYGLDELQPQNPSSWTDERQRIVVDARREAALLGAAQEGAPTEVAGALATMETYAGWLASTVQDAADFSAAVSAISSYPEAVDVSLAVATVTTWRNANCPS